MFIYCGYPIAVLYFFFMTHDFTHSTGNAGMRVLICLALVSAALCSNGFTNVTLDDNEEKRIVNFINKARCEHEADPLIWSQKMEMDIKQRCDPTLQIVLPHYNGSMPGQLLFKLTAPWDDSIPNKALSIWLQGEQFYDYASHGGQQLHRYSSWALMISRATTAIACTACMIGKDSIFNCWINPPHRDTVMGNMKNILPATQNNNCAYAGTPIPHTMAKPTATPTKIPETLVPLTKIPQTAAPVVTLTEVVNVSDTRSVSISVPIKVTSVPTSIPTAHPTALPTSVPDASISIDDEPWICVAFKFRSAWPKNPLSRWISKLTRTLLIIWKDSPQRDREVVITFICPLENGRKPRSMSRCIDGRQIRKNNGLTTLAETMKELRNIGDDDGVFVEVQISRNDKSDLESDIHKLTHSLSDAASGRPPLYDVENFENNLLVVDIIEMNDGSSSAETQNSGGGPWSAGAIENWEEPEPQDEDSDMEWTLIIVLAAAFCATIVAAGGFLAVKRRGANNVVTVSEFYRSMPDGYNGPIPEEHYGNDEVNSVTSMEMDAYVGRARNWSGSQIQPIGRI